MRRPWGVLAAPTLPITGTRTVNVATEAQLQSVMSNLRDGDTILLANGTYNLSDTLYIVNVNNVTIRGASGCQDVILVGRGMDNANSGSVLFGVWLNSLNTTIAHPTIRDTYDNSIIFNAGAQSPHVYSVKLLNAGSQFIKSNPTWPDRSRQMGWTTAWSNILSSSTRLDHQRPIMALVLVIRMV